MNEFSLTEGQSEREVVTNPAVLMQRFFASPPYLQAFARFKQGKNPEIPDERFQKAFHEMEEARFAFVDFVQDHVTFGYNSNHYPAEVREAVQTYMDHVDWVQRKNRVIRDYSDLQSDDYLRQQYHNEAATQLHISGIAPSRELAKGLVRAMLHAAGYDNLASAKDSCIRRAHITLNN